MPPPTESAREQIIESLLARLQAIDAEGSTVYWFTVDPDSVRRGEIDWNQITDRDSPFLTLQALADIPMELAEGALGRDERTLQLRVRGALWTEETARDTAGLADRDAERFLADQKRALFTDPSTGAPSPDLESLILHEMRITSATTVVEWGRTGWKTTEINLECDYRTEYPKA